MPEDYPLIHIKIRYFVSCDKCGMNSTVAEVDQTRKRCPACGYVQNPCPCCGITLEPGEVSCQKSLF